MKAIQSIQLLFAKVVILALMIQSPLWCRADPLGSWNLVLSNAPSLTGMAYGNGTFVGVGSGLDYISHDGSNWMVYANKTFLNQEGIVYANGYFVSYGTNTTSQRSFVCKSTDGIHWTTVYTNNSNIYDATYGNNTWVFLASTTNAYEVLTASVTSSNWNWTQLSLTSYPAAITFLNGTFVMQLYFEEIGVGDIFVSPDGSAWQYTAMCPDTGIGTIAYGKSTYLYSGSGWLWTSPDLVNWSLDSKFPVLGEQPTGTGIGFFGNRFVAAFEYNYYMTNSPPAFPQYTTQSPVFSSSDGINWTINGAISASLDYIINVPDIPIQFVAYGQGRLLTSTGNNIFLSGVFSTNSSALATSLKISTYSGVTIDGTAGAVYQIQYSTDMNTWQTITNFILPYSPYLWIDTGTTVSGQRFYRSVQVQ